MKWQQQTPVLAKRKTTLMKEMEREKKEKTQAKAALEKKKEALNHQLYIPEPQDAERERHLRRIATRGGKCLAGTR